MSKAMIHKSLIALLIIALMIPPTYFGGIALQILLAFVALMVSYEISTLINEDKPNYLQILITTVAMVFIYYVRNEWVFGCIIAWVMVLFVLDIIMKSNDAHFVAYTFLISMIVSIALRTVNNIYAIDENHNGFFVLLFICIATYFCDTGAYFFGSFYGKKKLAPNISPNKTWEGAIGGYFCGMIPALIVGLVILNYLPKGLIITASIVIPLISQFGDLSFSLIKRKFNKKDFGSFLPGHGGVLDRVDSLIFALILFQALMVIWGL